MAPSLRAGRAFLPAMFLLMMALGRAHADPAESFRPEWLPWGEEAFARAKSTNRPLLVSIVAGWDHWCHLMDRDAYADSAIVAVIHDRFIPVLVDRDLRPDVDRRYGMGGWPSTVILTPDGDLIRGDTFIDAHLLGPFLLRVSQYWRQNQERIVAGTSAARLGTKPAWSRVPDTATIPEGDMARSAVDSLLAGGVADLAVGGIGRAPKFPLPIALRFSLLASRELGDPRLIRFVRTTLDSMEAGAIYDRVGGGFHRYSERDGWNRPPGEKLLSTNAEILDVLTLAFNQTGDSTYLEVARNTARYLRERLFDADRNLFAAAEDADDDRGVAGGYVHWTAEEIRALLPGREAEFTLALYGFDRAGVLPDMSRPLVRATSPSEAAARAGVPLTETRVLEARGVASLEAARRRRHAPALVTIPCVDANAAAAIACFHLARAVPEEAALSDLARRVIASLRRGGCDPARPVPHVVGGGESSPRLLRDQVLFTRALLELYLEGGDPRALDEAKTAARTMVTGFADPASGALLDRIASPGDIAGLAAPLRDIEENGLAAELLLALAELDAGAEFREDASRLVRAFLPTYRESGFFAGHLGLVAWRLRHGALRVIVRGDAGSPATRALRCAAERLATGWVLAELVDTRRNPGSLKARGLPDGPLPRASLSAGRSAYLEAETPDALRDAALRLVGTIDSAPNED